MTSIFFAPAVRTCVLKRWVKIFTLGSVDWKAFNFKDDYGINDIIDFKELDYDFYDMDEFGNLDFTDDTTTARANLSPATVKASPDTGTNKKRPKAYFQHWINKKKPQTGITTPKLSVVS